MNLAIEKTLSLVLLIAIGVLLKKKVKNREQLGGIKMLILSVALPATIFVALLKIEIEPALLFLPLLALGFNVLMFFASRFFLPYFGVAGDSAASRTLIMLMPSLAPGLSCFPFLLEYLGEESLALAALADVGNKIFVLIILYLVAMSWFLRGRPAIRNETEKRENQMKGLLLSLVREPVNLVIVSALILLGFGLNLDALPAFLQDSVLRMSALMTPMVLLFIGMAVRFKRQEFVMIGKLLCWRSGFAFLLSAVLVALLPGASAPLLLLAVVFPQSACSFWPFAHMSAVAHLEEAEIRAEKRPAATFNLDLALNVLALSLPFSTVLILAIFSTGSFFVNPLHLLGFGLGFLMLAAGPAIFRKNKKSRGFRQEHQEYTEPRRLAKILEE